jgi:hypothetical protein
MQTSSSNESEIKNETTSSKAAASNAYSVEDFLEGTYINIKDGESRTLEFDLNKVAVIEKQDFNGNPTRKVEFLVTDPNRGPDQQEKKLQLSRKHAYKVHKELKAGAKILEIYRSGQDD